MRAFLEERPDQEARLERVRGLASNPMARAQNTSW
jgi:hypothetical protein